MQLTSFTCGHRKDTVHLAGFKRVWLVLAATLLPVAYASGVIVLVKSIKLVFERGYLSIFR